MANESSRLSVLNVTQAKEIVSINQPVKRTNPSNRIILHKEIRGKRVEANAGSIPAVTLPAYS